MVHGAPTVNPERAGTKCAFWYRLTVPAGQTAELRLRLRPAGRRRGSAAVAFGAGFDEVMAQRRAEADEFYAELTPAGASADEALVLRQACAGHAVEQAAVLLRRRPLAGRRPDPAGHRRESRKSGRNAKWRNFDGFDIISMPDKWEYPWFAAWDLAFHTRPAGPPGPGVRQVPADPGLPGVVPAPERGAAGVRVGLRRRQPAGARLGGAAGLRHRRRPRPRFPQPGLRQAPGQLHLVGEPGGRRGQQPVRGRLPRPGQHRPDRPLPPAGRLHPGAVRRHRLDGRLRAGHGLHRRHPQLDRQAPGAGPGA